LVYTDCCTTGFAFTFTALRTATPAAKLRAQHFARRAALCPHAATLPPPLPRTKPLRHFARLRLQRGAAKRWQARRGWRFFF
jgi:hypothetical protein